MLHSKKIIFLLVVALRTAETSELFLTEPSKEPYFVRDGDEELTLPCVIGPEYFDQTKYELSWTRYHNDKIRVITKNEKVLAKKNANFVLDYDATIGNYNLKIIAIEKNSVEGTYHCNIIATDGSDLQNSALATVVVLVPPGDPMLDAVPTESVIEGDVISAKCLSGGGSPQPSVLWTFPNGTEALAQTTYFRDGVTESLLHFRVTASDDGKYIQCDVTNKAMAEGEFKTVKSPPLTVLYKPSVFVTPVENLTHLSVEEGVPVNLTCHAKSNPPAHSFEWKHLSSGERYQGKIWPIVANTSMAGDFECRATNELGEGTAVLNFVVQYAPRIDLPASIDPDQLTDIDVECKTKALPEVMDIHWVGPNGFRTNGSRLVIKSVTKDQTGNYTCIANNFLTVYGQSGSQQRVTTKSMLVNVKRKPGLAQIISLQHKFDVGSTINLKCSSPDAGNPSASYTWASPLSGGIYGLEEHIGDTFTVRNAQLSDNGIYSCKAYNEIGEGQAAFLNLTIIEKAAISSPLPTEKVFTAGDLNKTLECEAEGYPVPTVSWLKDGIAIKNNVTNVIYESKCSPGDFCTQKVLSTLLLETPLKWTNKGNFTCIADNGSLKKDEIGSSWTVVRILHKPVILRNKSSEKILAAADVGTQTMIICKVSGRPEPVFHWYRNGSEISENDKYSIHNLSPDGKPDQYEQFLQIEDVQDEDFGEYVCRAANANGDDDVVIELRRTSPPGVPEGLRKLSATSTSILLSWNPQFDGGFEQTFVLEAKKTNPFTGEIEEHTPTTVLSLSDVMNYEEYENDGSVQTRAVYNFTGLTPMSTFNIRLRAENKKGKSDLTPFLFASTEDVIEDKTMMSPSRLSYDQTNQKFSVEPKLPTDACILLYVSYGGVWRTTICHASNSVISDLVVPNTYKARFCTLSNKLKCSPFSDQVAVGYENAWKTSILVPFVFFCFIGLSVCVFFAVCCKTRSTPKNSKLVPLVFPSLSNSGETKKTLNYKQSLSNADISTPFENSGESQPKAIIVPVNGNYSEYKESPTPEFDEKPIGICLESLSEEDERRVVREIIV